MIILVNINKYMYYCMYMCINTNRETEKGERERQRQTSSPVISVVDGMTILTPFNFTTLTLTVSLEYINGEPKDTSID